MNVIGNSTLHDYARQYWRRERDKRNPQGVQYFAEIERGVDPVKLMRETHPYKLPNASNSQVSIVVFTDRDELENLLVHDYMPEDDWMKERGLTPQPFSRRLKTLAAICLERGYFTSKRSDRQIRNFREWKARGSLRNVIVPDERPMIETAEAGEYEIVDGWGRLLPLAALVVNGMAFEPFQAFLASPGRQAADETLY